MSRRWRVLCSILRVIVMMRGIVTKTREKMKLYCCRLFPNDFEFERETLVRLWMAMGFSSQSCIEKFCERYFDILLDEQYIIFSSIDIVTGRYLYKINHEGNDNIGEKETNKEDFYAVLEYEDANGSKSRHISLVSNCINETTFKKLQNFGGELRTLLFIHNYGSSLNKIPFDMFLGLEFLRALDLSGSDIVELPRSIGNVRQLRYLDLSFTLIESLPESIDQLHQLQTLKLQGCKHLHELPKGIKELICLRHLDLNVLGQLTFLPKGIGALTELCTLSAFLVDSEEGCSIRELKFLNKLKGSFCVSGLENVALVRDFEEAALQDKKYVTQLQLRWSDRISYSNKDKQLGNNIIASLNLNRGLRDLQIVCYPGSDIPAWVDFRVQQNLISITLLNCNNNDLSLPLGQLPNLKCLSIIHMNWVTKIKGWSHEGGDEAYVAFPKLEKLEIECMFILETWIDEFKHGDFPFLSTLIIKQCPKLTRLPFLPHLQVLKHLEISDCPEFKCFPDGVLSTSLKTLIIDGCPFLEKRCSKEGEDWHKVKRIPNIWIDLQEDSDVDDSSSTTEDICSINEDVSDDIDLSAGGGEIGRCTDMLENIATCSQSEFPTTDSANKELTSAISKDICSTDVEDVSENIIDSSAPSNYLLGAIRKNAQLENSANSSLVRVRSFSFFGAVAAVGLASGLAQTLVSALQTKEVREMCSLFGCETQLMKLKDTMKNINALLLDVDSKRQGLINVGQVRVEMFKDVVYDIDDLLDEFATIGQQRKQMKDAEFYKKVGNFFTRNKYFFNYKMYGEVKKLSEKLDDIAKDHKRFGYSIDVSKHAVRRAETSSTISDLEVIGRDGDQETILRKLLSDSIPSGFNGRFVCIVGIGGLGKTTLAQLVFNHNKVQEAFSLRIWVCVSEEFGPKEILGKMLNEEVSDLEAAQGQIKALLQNKKYLLVLDDVWNESHEAWRDLMPYLVSDVIGSKIIVTSRSKKVATSIGGEIFLHELQGLSDRNSWYLFKRIAFETESEDEVDPDLVAIGKDILKKSANVPLCIRVIATMLYKQDKNIWLSFRSVDLAEMCHDQNSIMPILMFSYYQLTPELKSCFSFCSLFPKDHVMEKELLIQLWMAEGYLAPNGKAHSLEDVGDQYFTILLNRCFFQNMELDEHGDVYSFKMHDLMHDLALNVAGKESLINTPTYSDRLRGKIRHLSTTIWDRDISSLYLTNTLRTYISVPAVRILEASSLDKVTPIVSKCKRLRVLSLSNFGISYLPKGLGKLLHLRFLDLSENGFELLPNSITKLHNLQILRLRECSELKELPEDMSKLVNLRALDIHNCFGLTYMPRGMDNLKNLHMLTQFVVGGIDSKQTQGSKLGDLQALRSLKGDLCIRLLEFSPCNMPHAASAAFILKDAHLSKLEIVCDKKSNTDQSQVHERLVEDLCPNDNICGIRMGGYEGTKLPSWATKLESDLNGLQHVTSLSRFGHLNVLELYGLKNVEYIEIASRGWESKTFFPVLEKFTLFNMPKLKGWWRGLRWREMEGGGGCLVDANGDIHTERAVSLPFFPRLHDLIIEGCKSMTYFPPCPHVKQLRLRRVNEALTFCMKGGASSSNVSASLCLEIDKARLVNSVVSEFVGGAVSIKLILECDMEMKSMGIVKEGFERLRWGLKWLSIASCEELDMEDEEEEGMPWMYLQSLSSLKLFNLPNMVKLPKGLQYLTSLQSLLIYGCYNLELDMEDEEEDGMPWRYLQSLSSLDLIGLPKMVKLPKGLHYLTSLQSLLIHACNNLEELGDCIGFLTSLQSLRVEYCNTLKALPECIGFLTSLLYLSIRYSNGIRSLPESMRHLTSLTALQMCGICSELRERCRQPDGEDWPKLCHIPTLYIAKEDTT